MIEQPIVTAERLGKRYRGARWALRDVDLELLPGELTLLVGPNGAGKSTLMRSLIGFERPSTGQVRIAGVDPSQDRARALTHVGYVAQDAPLYRLLTAADHIALTAAERDRVDAPAALARLERLQIPHSSRPNELSGGQRAQLALTIALACRPAILILDEPLASLDPLARREFAGDLRDSARGSGTGLLLSSHVVGEAEGTCDRVVVLGAGDKKLDARIDSALADHAVWRGEGQPPHGSEIGRFPGTRGGWMAIYRRADAPELRSPTLEELVLGYLAGGRRPAAGGLS